jgi:hypothetical protein
MSSDLVKRPSFAVLPCLGRRRDGPCSKGWGACADGDLTLSGARIGDAIGLCESAFRALIMVGGGFSFRHGDFLVKYE